MPGWHKQIKDLVSDGKVEMVGIIQEQHPDRCRLFAQWQNFDWPILNDPINLIPTRAVPVVIAIDEHGVVQSTRPNPNWVRTEFITTDYPAPTAETTKPADDPRFVPYLTADQLQNADKTLRSAMATTVWGSALNREAMKQSAAAAEGTSDHFNKAIALYDSVIKKEPRNAVAHFGRGVALRMRYESSERQPDDFQAAVNAWGMALDIDPNHYIYRRRIQQYGPRLTKPYPFYDWVTKARADIRARGDEPVKLAIEPGGAEIASPQRSFNVAAAGANPDEAGRITRDTKGLIEISTVTVPARTKPGQTTRLHLAFRTSKDAHWNNEASPVQVWIDQPSGWKLEKSLSELPQPGEAESHELRQLELEAKLPRTATSTELKGYALYYVCEDKDGTCLYLRQDFSIPVTTTSAE